MPASFVCFVVVMEDMRLHETRARGEKNGKSKLAK